MRKNLRQICFYLLLLALSSPVNAQGSQLADEIYNQGITHYSNRNFRDAEFYLGQVLHDNPQHHIARYYLAAAMGAMGKQAQALPHVDYLLKIDPQNKSYQVLRQQLLPAGNAPAATPQQVSLKQPAEGDAYMPGIRKTVITGGGMEPLISAGTPLTPAPQLPARYETLQEAVNSVDPQVRREAIRSLIDKKDSSLLPLLAWALKDQPCRELAGRALLALEDKGVDSVIDYAKNATASGDRNFAYVLLGRFNNSKADKFVLEAWKKGETACMQTLETLLAEKGKTVLPEMIEALGSSNKNLRFSAAQVIDLIGEEAILPLIDLLKNGKGGVRVEAVAILGGLSRDIVFRKFPKDLLEKLTSDETAEVAAFASSLLPKPEPIDPAAAPAIIP